MRPQELNRIAQCTTINELRRTYRELAFRYHPDYGGTIGQFVQLQESYESACRTLNYEDFQFDATPLDVCEPAVSVRRPMGVWQFSHAVSQLYRGGKLLDASTRMLLWCCAVTAVCALLLTMQFVPVHWDFSTAASLFFVLMVALAVPGVLSPMMLNTRIQNPWSTYLGIVVSMTACALFTHPSFFS